MVCSKERLLETVKVIPLPYQDSGLYPNNYFDYEDDDVIVMRNLFELFLVLIVRCFDCSDGFPARNGVGRSMGRNQQRGALQ